MLQCSDHHFEKLKKHLVLDNFYVIQALFIHNSSKMHKTKSLSLYKDQIELKSVQTHKCAQKQVLMQVGFKDKSTQLFKWCDSVYFIKKKNVSIKDQKTVLYLEDII